MRTVKPGDIGLYRIGGFLGWLVNMGQAIIGDSSRYTHAFIVMDDGTVLAAQPAGARYDSLDLYVGQNNTVILDVPLTDQQRSDIVRNARQLHGVKYGFSGYLYIGLSALNFRPAWLVRYVTNNGRMICSQLVDYVYCKSGIHLFNDGRLSNDVTPGDLADLIAERNRI